MRLLWILVMVVAAFVTVGATISPQSPHDGSDPMPICRHQTAPNCGN